VKNVQVIDGADNCSYAIYSFSEEEFALVFPEPGQNIEFIEDAIIRVGDEALGKALASVWKRSIKKTELNGLHGTLFYELTNKKKYYPTKKEEEMVTGL